MTSLSFPPAHSAGPLLAFWDWPAGGPVPAGPPPAGSVTVVWGDAVGYRAYREGPPPGGDLPPPPSELVGPAGPVTPVAGRPVARYCRAAY